MAAGSTLDAHADNNITTASAKAPRDNEQIDLIFCLPAPENYGIHYPNYPRVTDCVGASERHRKKIAATTFRHIDQSPHS